MKKLPSSKSSRVAPSNKQPDTRPQRRFSLRNLKEYAGLIVGGTREGLRKHDYKLKIENFGKRGRVLSGTEPSGAVATFVDKNVKGHRAVAKKRGMKIQGRDVDHTVAKSNLGSGVFSRLQAIGKRANRSAGRNEAKRGKATLENGVIKADRSMIRKILNYTQEKPIGRTPRAGTLSGTFNGYSGNAKAALNKNSAPKASPKKAVGGKTVGRMSTRTAKKFKRF